MTYEQPTQDKIKCTHCGNHLGICTTKRSLKGTYKTDFNLTKPKVIDGVKYTRIACSDCFHAKFGDVPAAPNVMGKNEMTFLLGVPEEVAQAIIDKKAVTLANMIARYGEEEGTKRFDSYRARQAETNTREYKKSVHGWTDEQFDAYNKSRAVTIENMIARYGEEEGTKRFQEYCERQAYAGVTVEYYIEKLGEELGRIEYGNMIKSKLLTLSNFKRKYGDIEGELRFSLLAEKKKLHSDVASELFSSLDESCDGIYDYAPKGEEYMFVHMEHVFLLDFCDQKSKKVIEFYGDFWHMNPAVYQSDTLRSDLLAHEVWGRDMGRVNILATNGFQVHIVWERDYRNNKQAVIQECLDFLRD